MSQLFGRANVSSGSFQEQNQQIKHIDLVAAVLRDGDMTNQRTLSDRFLGTYLMKGYFSEASKAPQTCLKPRYAKFLETSFCVFQTRLTGLFANSGLASGDTSEDAGRDSSDVNL